MVETAAHLSDHVFPRQPVRQWVLSVPKRLRYFMQRCVPPKCSPAHYLWAVLVARIYEVFPLLCPVCGG